MPAILFLLLYGRADAQRIYIENATFKVNGQPIFILGANTPWKNWNDFGHSFDYTWWNTHFSQMHQAGVNATRVWISCSGENASPVITARTARSPAPRSSSGPTSEGSSKSRRTTGST